MRWDAKKFKKKRTPLPLPGWGEGAYELLRIMSENGREKKKVEGAPKKREKERLPSSNLCLLFITHFKYKL